MKIETSNEKRILNHSDIENIPVKINLIKEMETRKDSVRAIVNVTFFGCLVIKGYRIWYSSRGLYVSPPATPHKGKFVEIVYMENKVLWKKLEEKIIECYQSEEFSKSINGQT